MNGNLQIPQFRESDGADYRLCKKLNETLVSLAAEINSLNKQVQLQQERIKKLENQ